MKQSLFMEKYPIYSLQIGKAETSKKSVDEIVEYFKEKIAENGKAIFIATFDHYAHTKRLGGEMGAGIVDAKNLVFCFGYILPNAQVMAVRPRSIGIVDQDGTFLVTFLEAPVQTANETMVGWARGLVDKA